MSQVTRTRKPAATVLASRHRSDSLVPAQTVSRTEQIVAKASCAAAVAAPLVFAVLSLLHPEFEDVEELPELAATTDGWYALHAGSLVAVAALAVAALALARALRPVRPLLSTIGAGMTCLGVIPWMALIGIEMALPAIAKDEATWPILVDFLESSSITPLLTGFVLLPLGLLVLGIAAMRDWRRPRWHGALIVVGTLLTVPEVAALYVPGFVASAAGFAAVLYWPTPVEGEV